MRILPGRCCGGWPGKRKRPSVTWPSPEPVRAHVAALIAAGMEPERIVELAGRISIYFIDGLLRGAFPNVSIKDARNLLLIRA